MTLLLGLLGGLVLYLVFVRLDMALLSWINAKPSGDKKITGFKLCEVKHWANDGTNERIDEIMAQRY